MNGMLKKKNACHNKKNMQINASTMQVDFSVIAKYLLGHKFIFQACQLHI
jgi:hypothetical protein